MDGLSSELHPPQDGKAVRSKHQQAVDAFMRGAGQHLPSKPTVPDEATRIGRARLLLEECLETIEALGVTVVARDEIDGECVVLGMCDSVLDFETFPCSISLSEIIDGCIDLRVVATGTLSACGIPDTPFQEEVDNNNLLKIAGGHLDEHGKFIKPKNHPKPDIAGILAGLCDVSQESEA